MDWRIIGYMDSDAREEMTEAIEKRAEETRKPALKVDWLRRKVFFRGLDKDDDYVKSTFPPGTNPPPHTYVVKMVECESCTAFCTFT